MILMPKQSIDQ